VRKPCLGLFQMKLYGINQMHFVTSFCEWEGIDSSRAANVINYRGLMGDTERNRPGPSSGPGRSTQRFAAPRSFTAIKRSPLWFCGQPPST
jgi:hypothetical protein